MTKRIVYYILFTLINVALFNTAFYFILKKYDKPAEVAPNPSGDLTEKLQYYKNNKNKFGILFIGDSRTYTNINNLQVDTTLKTGSYNLGMWSNWFPTQYAFLYDLLPEVPDSTTIVFSIGHQNFNKIEIQGAYPISNEVLNDYYDWGFTKADLKKPVGIAYNPLKPILFLSDGEAKKRFRQGIKKHFAVIFNPTEQKQVITKIPEQTDLLQNLKKNPLVSKTEMRYQGDTLTSYEVYWTAGNYWRVEIDSLFFRKKQEESRIEIQKKLTELKEFHPDSVFVRNFRAIMRLLKTHSSRLNIIINEFGEAPYVYVAGREQFDSYMNNQVKPYVTSLGFRYMNVNMKDVKDYLYFDFNHLNHKGSILYTNRFIAEFKNNQNYVHAVQ